MTATPKTSPFEEVAPPFPPIDVDDISPSEAEARSKARASRIPSITLSNEEHVSVILLNNFSTLNIHRAASFDDGTDDVPVQVSSSESTVIQSNDSVEEPGTYLERTVFVGLAWLGLFIFTKFFGGMPSLSRKPSKLVA